MIQTISVNGLEKRCLIFNRIFTSLAFPTFACQVQESASNDFPPISYDCDLNRK